MGKQMKRKKQTRKKFNKFNKLWFIPIGIVILVVGSLIFFNIHSTSEKNYKLSLICEGNSIAWLYKSGNVEIHHVCKEGSQCVENLDGSASCITSEGDTSEGDTSEGDTSEGDEEKICPYGTYLGDLDICFDYAGKDLPQGLDYEECIENALDDYYSNFPATTYEFISWITAKTMELDQYDSSDSSWKYIGCARIKDTNTGWFTWGITADCKTGRSGDMLTDSQASNHDICGSERLRG